MAPGTQPQSLAAVGSSSITTGGRLRVAVADGGRLPPTRAPGARARRDISPTIVYLLVTATTVFSFLDLYLLGTHVHS